VPGLRGQVTRPRRVRVQAQDLDGRSLDQEWVGIAAAIVQHEVDHLMGTLFVDRADTRTLCFSEPFQAHVPEAMRVWDGGTTC
jgi:peptide deformylase